MGTDESGIVSSEQTPERPQDITPASDLPSGKERRIQPRHPVDARAVLLLIKSATGMPGRVVDLSLNGCQVCTQERFTPGIFVRVEVEFRLNDIPFRLSGVTQSIHGVYGVGVRFLGVSDRSHGQLVELIAELNEAH